MTKKIFHFLFHEWRAICTYHYVDVSFGGNITNTIVTLKCDICGKIKQKDLEGKLELDELTK